MTVPALLTRIRNAGRSRKLVKNGGQVTECRVSVVWHLKPC